MRARLPVVVSIVLAVSSATAAEPASKTETEKKKGRAEVTIERVEYKGWKNNLRLANGDVELIVTLDVGPRVISYRLSGVDGKNVLKEYEDQLGKSGESEWMIRGGHRLWTSPEDTTRTYALDNASVSFKELGPASVRLTPPADKANGIQKEIDLTLKSSGTAVTLQHRITNVGSATTDLALWSLTVMAPGGMEILPLPPRRPHPGSVKNARSAADFAPNLLISAWPFIDFQDPRWHFGSKFITLTQDAKRGATKLGLAHKPGVAGYLNAGTLFVKRFEYREGQHYPDNGVNYETFTNEDMLEMESLGPLTTLAPGKAVEHVETWELFGGVDAAKTEGEIEAKVAPMLK